MPQTYNAIKAAVIVHAQAAGAGARRQGYPRQLRIARPVYIEGGDWDYIKNNMPAIYDASVAKIPRGTLGSAEEIANAVVFLASPAASLITGVNLVADGGYTKRVQL